MTDIVITGATGVVGRRAVRELLAAGHRVAGVTRTLSGRRLLERLGARAVEADVFDQTSLTAAFAGAGAVVNLLTHIPAADCMATPGAWDENDRLRREASAAIARAADAAGAARLVQESLAFAYADGGDAWLDEDTPRRPLAAGAGRVLRRRGPGRPGHARRVGQLRAARRPRFEASRDEHDRAVRAFAQAVAEGDLDALLAVLDPDVVWTADGGGFATASRKPMAGADRVARAWLALRRKPVIEPTATPIELNGQLGLLIGGRDGHRSVVSFVVDGDRIARIDVVRNPEKLRRV